jgi:hypothetical protein
VSAERLEVAALLENAAALRLRPGERLVFWTSHDVSVEQSERFAAYMLARGVPALLVGSVRGAAIQHQDDNK